VRRHVVRPFVAVAQQRVAIRDEPREEALEVPAHVGIRVLLHQQACRRVADEERQCAAGDTVRLDPASDRWRDVDQAATGGLELEGRGELPQHAASIRRRAPCRSRAGTVWGTPALREKRPPCRGPPPGRPPVHHYARRLLVDRIVCS